MVGGSWHGSCSPRHMREGALDQLQAGQLPRPQGIRLRRSAHDCCRPHGCPEGAPTNSLACARSPQANSANLEQPSDSSSSNGSSSDSNTGAGEGGGKVSGCSRATAAVRVRRRPRTRNEGSCLPQGEAGCLSESERRASKVITPTTACRRCGTQQRRPRSDPTEEEETPDPPRLWRAAGHSLQA